MTTIKLTPQKEVRRFRMLIILINVFIIVIIAAGRALASDGEPENDKGNPNSPASTVQVAENVNVTARAESLGKVVNSPYREFKPLVSPEGDRLYFTRQGHPGNVGGIEDHEDIWYSENGNSRSTWSKPVRLPGILNNEGPNFISGISVSGDTLILGNQYRKKGRMRAGVSYSVNVNGEWSTPVAITIENDYNISSQANYHVNLHNGVIIQAIERDESFGDRDLYVSFWNGTTATEPVNIGGMVNSNAEESSPYLAPDNKTLYFASRGHDGYGGLDIYVTRRLDETWLNWSEPKNLGPAVNSELDDEFFTISHDNQYAYFSKQVSIHNIDLYRIKIAELFLDNLVAGIR